MYQTPSNGMKMKPRVLPVQPHSSSKFQSISFKSIGTQTISDNTYGDHTEQITQLLTEVAIALGYKAKLEHQISEIREESTEIHRKYAESRVKLEQEIEKLKCENFKKEMEMSRLKIYNLEEQKNLLDQVSTLKSEIQNVTQENEITCQDLRNEKQQLQLKINISKDDLKKEAEKNVNLQLKVAKYKNKLRYVVDYFQNLLQDFKEKETKEIQTEQKTSTSSINVQPNVEDLILSELFFKPSPLPVEVAELFFNQNT